MVPTSIKKLISTIRNVMVKHGVKITKDGVFVGSKVVDE